MVQIHDWRGCLVSLWTKGSYKVYPDVVRKGSSQIGAHSSSEVVVFLPDQVREIVLIVPSLRIFYITTSLYIVFLMTRVYARTREREKAWKMGLWSLVGSVVCAPVVAAIFMRGKPFTSEGAFEVCIATGSNLRAAMLTICLDSLHLYAYPRIALHPSAATPSPSDVCPDRH